MPRINGERLIADLRRLREFGATGNGVVRQSFSPVDLESRQWLIGRMEEAGLVAKIDGVGTVIGCSRKPGKALLIGSHTDTQPRGGWLDGAMGVMYGLEVARALGESDDTRDLAVDVASWIDEEGTFVSLFGSRIYCGRIAREDVIEARSAAGQSLGDAIRSAKLDHLAPATYEPGRYAGYLEAHIEQGGVLEQEGKRIGVVTAIVGIRTFELRFKGAQNHAGTTPMPMRKDAGMALIKLAYAIDARFAELASERTVWTIGDVAFDPGAHSIVPGRARMFLQFRDPDDALLDRFETALHDIVARADERGPVGIAVEEHSRLMPAPMDAGMQDHLAAAAERHADGLWIRMPSGAGHDAQVLADVLPAAMLFVPSIGGVSHDFAEDSNVDDIVLGCQVFADAAATILRPAG